MQTAKIMDLEHGPILEFAGTEHNSSVYGFCGGAPIQVKNNGTLFGFVIEGEVSIESEFGSYLVRGENYFCIPTHSGIRVTGHGRGYGVFHPNYNGLPCVGGPVEKLGRLRYIDGCSDTILVSPPLKGDPCFNLLHFPGGIVQTKHTHPSIRAGMIHQGSGSCITEEGEEVLSTGKLFLLQPDAIHAFTTTASKGMTLTVYHPDTDFGPTHEEHPMLNRTIVDGVSAKYQPDIRTKDIVY